MRKLITSSIVCLAMAMPVASGCGGDGGEQKSTAKAGAKSAGAKAKKTAPTPSKAVDERVTKAANVAIAVAQDPDAADSILEKHELDREKLDALMYEIAADPELSRAYAQARADGLRASGQ